MEVSINTNAMKVNYEQKPCYDIVFSKDFNLLNDEIQQLNISNKRICIVTESNVGPLYANEVKDIFMLSCWTNSISFLSSVISILIWEYLLYTYLTSGIWLSSSPKNDLYKSKFVYKFVEFIIFAPLASK